MQQLYNTFAPDGSSFHFIPAESTFITSLLLSFTNYNFILTKLVFLINVLDIRSGKLFLITYLFTFNGNTSIYREYSSD